MRTVAVMGLVWLCCTRGLAEPGGLEGPVLGFHATSVQALKVALERGSLPAGTIRGGSLFFAPTREGIAALPQELRGEARSPDSYDPAAKAYDGVVTWYAPNLAANGYLQERLHLPYEESARHFYHLRLTRELPKPDETSGARRAAIDYLTRHAGSRAALEKVWAEAQSKKGVVLVISLEAAKGLRIRQGDSPDDLALEIPDGLPLKYVTRIIPLGDYEREYLSRLGGGVSSRCPDDFRRLVGSLTVPAGR